MKNNYATGAIALAANTLLFVVGISGSIEALVLLLCALPVEALVGLLLLFYAAHRKTGLGLLIASVVSLIIGLSVCSNFNNPI